MQAALFCVLSAELFSGPEGVNASLGSFAIFTCHGKGYVVVWLINKISQFNIDSPLIDTEQIYEDGGNLSSILNITAVPETNNSDIQCYIHDTITNSYLSQLVQLRVQGTQKELRHYAQFLYSTYTVQVLQTSYKDLCNIKKCSMINASCIMYVAHSTWVLVTIIYTK